MIIECTNCHSKYQYDEDRFERKPSKKIRCAKCQHIFEISNPAYAAQAGLERKAGESTFMKKSGPAKPQESTAPKAEAPAPPPPDEAALMMPERKRLSLAIIEGPDAGNVFRIEKPRTTIGRSGADLVLNDSEASRQHAAFEVRDSTYTVMDLGSTNGTMVDGRKIERPVEVQNQSEFQVGASTLMLIVTEEA